MFGRKRPMSVQYIEFVDGTGIYIECSRFVFTDNFVSFINDKGHAGLVVKADEIFYVSAEKPLSVS